MSLSSKPSRNVRRQVLREKVDALRAENRRLKGMLGLASQAYERMKADLVALIGQNEMLGDAVSGTAAVLTEAVEKWVAEKDAALAGAVLKGAVEKLIRELPKIVTEKQEVGDGEKAEEGRIQVVGAIPADVAEAARS